MSKYHSYLNTAVEIVKQYKGSQPLAVFLKSFFAADKKYGSKDRKHISHLCYCFFRTGKIFAFDELVEDDALFKQCITAAVFLCTAESNEWLSQLAPQWNELAHLPVQDKFNTIKHHSSFSFLSSLSSVFPWKDELSETIDHTAFCFSFFMQPDLFLRVRPGYREAVMHKLVAAQTPYRIIGNDCIALPNYSKADAIIEMDKEAVIQDYSSQSVAAFMELVPHDTIISVWDCCAASGGKSILAKDVLKDLILTVSDIRPSILSNLSKRFQQAGIKNYKAMVVDLAKDSMPGPLFDLVIYDAPCSGSGTWGRTPEQLFYFQEKEIKQFHDLQKKILSNIISSVKPGGYLLYITCSVFRHENEDIVQEAVTRYDLEQQKMSILKGYDKRADTMFAALLHKPL